MSGPAKNMDEQRGTEAAPGRTRRKPLPAAYLLMDTSEQLSWPLHVYSSKHIEFSLRTWNCPEGDYAAVLRSEALAVEAVIDSEQAGRDDKAIRNEAQALAAVAQNVCVIERKSLPDFVGTMTAGHDRFEAECLRLRPYGFKAIVIEADLPQVREFCQTQSLARVESVVGSVQAFQVRYGLHVMFGSDRRYAAAYAFRLMERWCRERAAMDAW